MWQIEGINLIGGMRVVLYVHNGNLLAGLNELLTVNSILLTWNNILRGIKQCLSTFLEIELQGSIIDKK